jgi:general secretion pathway protein B
MSYILDALKKAERERHATKIPTLQTVHRTPWERRQPQWMWIAAAVVLLNAGLLIWFLRPESVPRKSSSSPAAPAVSSPPAPASAPATAPGPLAPRPGAERAAPTRPAVAATAPAEPLPPAPRAAASRQAPEKTTTKAGPLAAVAPVPSNEPRKPQGPDTPAPAAPEKSALLNPAPGVPPAPVPDMPAAPPAPASPTKPVEPSAAPAPGMQELTPVDQEGMPKLSLQLLVYSDLPAERLVYINNQKYVEGQSIEGKVLVEGISPDGAILSYKGKRFKLRQ